MQVALDANCVYTTKAGTARYTKGLLAGFRKLGLASPDITELAWPVENFDYRQPLRALKTAYRELIWCRTRAAAQLRSGGFDLLHSASHLDFLIPAGMPRVHTLYDLVIMRYPEKFRTWQRFAGHRFLKRLPSMDRIICISRFTADEAMSLLGLPARQLDVVHCGSDLAEVEDDGSPLDGGAWPDEFFLFVGSLEPGKNLRLLKAVYEMAKQSGRSLPPLMIAGARWAGVENEGAAPAAWSYLGRVSDSALASLYRRATALVFPSKYEGFGLPVLEAMSLGCPVICSRSGSIPEVAGEDAIYCDLDAASLLGAMQSLLADQGRRDALRAGGLERARLFSWSRCAQETMAVYESALK